MRRKAIVVGCDGQDGKIASGYLIEKGYSVLGIGKALAKENPPHKNFEKLALDITSFKKVSELIKRERPNEIYHLAAFHHSSQDKKMSDITLLTKSFTVNVVSLLNFLEAVRVFSPRSRIFYAASSLVFGDTETTVQNEETPFNPDTMYGITKADGIFLCRMYRREHDIFASTGILYNHESPFRKEQFLSQKIVTTAWKIKEGMEKGLTLGDLQAEVDWGYAPDYVEAMVRILQLKQSDDFIIASGKKHSVLYFVETAFGLLGLDWKKHVKEESKVITRRRRILVGNAQKLKKATGWKPKTSFNEMIKILIDERGKQHAT